MLLIGSPDAHPSSSWIYYTYTSAFIATCADDPQLQENVSFTYQFTAGEKTESAKL